MDCAIVDISGSSSSKSFTGPGLFRANTLPDGTCITIEGDDVVFPNPGPSVEYGGKMSKSSPVTKLSPCSYDEDTTVTIGPNGSSSSPGSGSGAGSSASASSSTKSASSSAHATTVKPTTVAQPTTAATTTTTKPETVRSTQGASTAAASTTTRPARVPFRSRYLLSSSSTATSSTKPTTTAVQKTTTSVKQEPTTTAAPPAATTSASSGSSNGGTWLKCLSSTTWALCDAAGCTNMGSVAAGTICKDGGIVMAPVNKKRDEERMVRVVSKEKKRRSVNAEVEPSTLAVKGEKRKMRRSTFAGPAGRAHVARSRSGH